MSDEIKGKNRRGIDWKTPIAVFLFGATLVTGTIAVMEGQLLKAVNTKILEMSVDERAQDKRISSLEINYAVFAVQLPDKIDNLTKLFEKHIAGNK
jgi:hypothetical protein